MTDEDMEAFLTAYEATWASREPLAMAAMWHPDGVLHHPALGEPVSGEIVPRNNDNTKATIPGFEWSLRRWASHGEVLFMEWVNRGEFGGGVQEWSGTDVMVVRDGRIAEERVYFDTYPLRRRLDPSLADVPLVDPSKLKG